MQFIARSKFQFKKKIVAIVVSYFSFNKVWDNLLVKVKSSAKKLIFKLILLLLIMETLEGGSLWEITRITWHAINLWKERKKNNLNYRTNNILCRENTLSKKNDEWEMNLKKEKGTCRLVHFLSLDARCGKEKKRENVIRITRISDHRALDEPPVDAMAYKTRSIRHSTEEYASFSPFCSQNESFKGN